MKVLPGYDLDELAALGAVELPGRPAGTLWLPKSTQYETRGGLVTVEQPVYVGATFPTAGPRLARFSEAFFTATRGVYAGQPLVPRPHQREVLDGIFELDPVTGRRVKRTAVLKAPRKWGKSNIAAPVALWFLLMEHLDGAQEIYGAAGDRKQASLVFREAKLIVQASEDLSSVITCYRDALEVKKTGSVYRCLSADAGLAQGLNPSCVIADEVGSWYGSDLWYALTLAVAARPEPLMVAISTPTNPDTESIFYKLCDHGSRVNAGEEEDGAFYYRAFEPREKEADWKAIETWAEANPGLGDYLQVDFFENTIKSTPEHEFRRFNLAQWTSSSNAWLSSELWEACADRDATIDPGEDAVLVVDGSYNGDSTACVLVTADGRIGIPRLEDGTQAIWEKPAVADTSWKVPIQDVEHAIAEDLAKRYTLTMLAFDPYRWQRSMEVLMELGLPVVEYPMGSAARMVRASARFEAGVRTLGIKHDGDPTLTRHVLNCGVKVDRLGARPVKANGANGHIDAAVCAVAGYELATARSDNDDDGLVPQVVQLW